MRSPSQDALERIERYISVIRDPSLHSKSSDVYWAQTSAFVMEEIKGKQVRYFDLLPLFQWLKIVFSFSILCDHWLSGVPPSFFHLYREIPRGVPHLSTRSGFSALFKRGGLGKPTIVSTLIHSDFFPLIGSRWYHRPMMLSNSLLIVRTRTQVSQSSSWPLAGRTSVI